MKSILLSIKPEWVAKILNKEKTIEVRKKFQKDYVGWVYIYVTKGNNPKGTFLAKTKDFPGFRYNQISFFYDELKDKYEYNGCYDELNGKVVARFWCDKVENVGKWVGNGYGTETITDTVFNLLTCLRDDQIKEYLGNSKKLFAIHISKLEIFDKPRELSEFRYAVCPQINCEYCKYNKTVEGDFYCTHKTLTKAPQNYCYVEV